MLEKRLVLKLYSFQVNSLFDSTHLLERDEADDTEETERILVGDLKELVESILKRTSCLPRLVSLFRSSGMGSLGRLCKRSKSEINILKLIYKEPKDFFFVF